LFIGKFDRGARANDMFEFNVKQQKDTSIHTCPKVIEFFVELLKCYSSNLVLDLFLGSGTTMVAAHQLNRKCYGMEIDPEYCQVIVDRMKLLDASLEVKINGKVIS
jgi:DNA modification methylase